MKKTGITITVTAKGDFGYHPGLKLDIVQGREYTIDESEFADQLFDRPAAGKAAKSAKADDPQPEP